MRSHLLIIAKISVSFLIFLCAFAFNPSCRINVYSDAEYNPMRRNIEDPAPYDENQIRGDLYERKRYAVRRGETFSDILSRLNVSAQAIATLVERARPVMDVRKLRAGNAYHVYQDTTRGRASEFLVYEQDPVHYVVFDLRDSLRVERGNRPVRTLQKHIQGEIEHSLYQTLEELNANPMVAIELSEIFAWQVDFYRIMQGDRFNVVYEEDYVGDQSVGIKRIKAARFTHDGDVFHAFPYAIDGSIDFYDAEGNSLRRPFLKAPLRFSRISSRYTWRRFHPVQKRYKAHLGTDYAAPTGTPVRSTADGTVIAAGYTRGNGRYVKVKHNGTYTTGYLHFSRIAKGIRKGIKVKQGDIIGYVGSTGLATGPHLCYRFWKNGRQVDPLREKLPDTVESIQPEYLQDYLDHVRSTIPLLSDPREDLPFSPVVKRVVLSDLMEWQTSS